MAEHIPERQDLDDPATKKDVLLLFNKVKEWKECTQENLEEQSEKVEEIAEEVVEKHVKSCPVSTVYEEGKSGENALNKMLKKRPDLGLLVELIAIAFLLAMTWFFG